MSPEEKRVLDEDLKAYFKQRRERLQKENPNREVSEPKILFIDTDETLSLFPYNENL
ncbi:hypothetical protein ACFQ3J_00275 [Paenibacillus provencensis]|uniref:Uncharacterized protein n=1 Tax=Paenibacillus provencensis TaxID=441151 RepID=A0ABW3PJ42_9BACL